jgi:two-component system CheB/CheR fusion protein
VVVVDDDHDATDTLVWLLQMAGHEVLGCYAGEEAVEKVCASCPDVMLIDLAMPGVDGNQVARRVRQSAHNKNTILIAITGYGDEAHRQLGMSAGFDHYLVKPVGFPALCCLLDGRRRKTATDQSSV